jgi:hypothetical protein
MGCIPTLKENAFNERVAKLFWWMWGEKNIFLVNMWWKKTCFRWMYVKKKRLQEETNTFQTWICTWHLLLLSQEWLHHYYHFQYLCDQCSPFERREGTPLELHMSFDLLLIRNLWQRTSTVKCIWPKIMTNRINQSCLWLKTRNKTCYDY